MKRLTAAVMVLAAVLLVALTILSVLDRQWFLAALEALAAAFLVRGVVQQRRAPQRSAQSRAAAARWTKPRVRKTIAGMDGEVAAVRAVRRADRELSLADAVALVRSVRPSGAATARARRSS